MSILWNIKWKTFFIRWMNELPFECDEWIKNFAWTEWMNEKIKHAMNDNCFSLDSWMKCRQDEHMWEEWMKKFAWDEW